MKRIVLNNLEFFIIGMVMGWATIIGLNFGRDMLLNHSEIKSLEFFNTCMLLGFFILATNFVLLELILKSIITQKSICKHISWLIFIPLLGMAFSSFFIGLMVLIKNNYAYFLIISFFLFLISRHIWRKEENIIPLSAFTAGAIIVIFILVKSEGFAYSIIMVCGYCLGIIGYLFKKESGIPIF